jgi:hypothetical protein
MSTNTKELDGHEPTRSLRRNHKRARMVVSRNRGQDKHEIKRFSSC